MNQKLFTISPSPHIHSGESIPKLMYGVLIALTPALFASFYYFGLGAIKVVLVATLSCVTFEYLIQKYLLKSPVKINDGSALLTGLLLAMNLPSNMPIWMTILGSLFAIGIAKMSFGGLGNNPFNPALAARVFLLISFPVAMTSWPIPFDAVTGATALGILKEGVKMGSSVSSLPLPDHTSLFMGNMGGSLGEVSALALIIGGLFLLYKKIITWQIPISMIIGLILYTGVAYLINDSRFASPLFHLLSGGLLLGAFFMATDLVTSPMTSKGMLIFGFSCGILTAIIRLHGAYPEGVSFAILIMNAFVPIINKLTPPRRFGGVK